MPQGPAQYTPQQILEAGQRAEADGRFEYANQFYHHLAEHYPKTPEARFAREGIQRLSQRLSPDVLRGRDGHQPSFQPTPAFRDDVTVPGSARQRPSVAPRPESPSFRPGGGPEPDRGIPAAPVRSREPAPDPMPRFYQSPPVGGPVAAESRRVQLAPAAHDPSNLDAEDDYPEPRRHYRLGRFVSGLLLIVGVLMVVAGLVLAVVPMAVKLTMAFGVTGIAVSAAGLAVLFVGLVFCLLAQLARAVFDGADAVRAMAEWQAALVATSHRNDKR